ncbi:AraC family transcriptional regulator [Geodermatophilus sp. YIM 151500]|uniref:AraC family transcriptional regulator n=1 Tax=Geodermatophilus sp. YIM 151500 TaxID=2984531 RepID=UPI0021E4BF51|nr:AraC family transcriptional regulator [Geodermatophilus sp. YIM 151500]MCV2490725.1 AraC family transcriptional regulator [Geodermatophilus sp. YIM 151500]
MVRRGPGGAPVYAFGREAGLPPVRTARLDRHAHAPGAWQPSEPHAHDFLVLVFFEVGGGELTVDARTWQAATGDVLVIAPGEVVTPEWTATADEAVAWTAFFPPDAVEARAPGTLGSWRAHPLLFPFVGRRAGGAQRLHVPEAQRAIWSRRFAELDRELRERADGYAEAALALLTLLLVDLARLAADVPGHLRLRDERLLAAVFDVVEQRFGEPISLRDVAASVRMSPGHLTTVVGQRTGRTVQQWITERRMTEARRLLAGTDLSVHAIAGRVGYRDAGYLIRRFRAAHGVTPEEWRRAGRAGAVTGPGPPPVTSRRRPARARGGD